MWTILVTVCLAFLQAEESPSVTIDGDWIVASQGREETYQEIKLRIWGSLRQDSSFGHGFWQLDGDEVGEYYVISRNAGTGPHYRFQIIDFRPDGILTWSYYSMGRPKIEGITVFLGAPVKYESAATRLEYRAYRLGTQGLEEYRKRAEFLPNSQRVERVEVEREGQIAEVLFASREIRHPDIKGKWRKKIVLTAFDPKTRFFWWEMLPPGFPATKQLPPPGLLFTDQKVVRFYLSLKADLFLKESQQRFPTIEDGFRGALGAFEEQINQPRQSRMIAEGSEIHLLEYLDREFFYRPYDASLSIMASIKSVRKVDDTGSIRIELSGYQDRKAFLILDENYNVLEAKEY